MKKTILLFVILALNFFNVKAQDADYDALVEKITSRSYPQWFKDAKLGIFIHWGLYSVPAYSEEESYAEWYLRGLQLEEPLRSNFMKDTYGQNFTYKDFAPLFKAELWNPDEWADLFKRAGAKYIMFVTKHHDGFALWPSKYNRNWNSMDVGPKRDLVGDLTKSIRKAGLKMGLYYSLAEWNHPLHRWYTDPHDSIGNYVDNYMIPQFKELIGTYKPSLIFADGEWFNTAKQWHAPELIDWYYNLVGDDALVNNRWGHGLDVGFLTPEYSAGIKVTDRPWTEVRGLGRSFGLNRKEPLDAYGTSKELIDRFVQVVANGGGMILNVGPKADGQIPLIQQERLVQLGDWLRINGEAIYGSKPYHNIEEEKKVTIKRVDSVINFNWVRNSPMKGIREDDFTAEWKGYIVAPTSGTYTFEVKADDAASVTIDNTLVIDQNYTAEGTDSQVMGANTGVSTNGVIKLKEGVAYPILVKFKEKKLQAEISLFWSTKKMNKELVPASQLFQDKSVTQAGLMGTYSSLKTYLCYTQNKGNIYAIALEWPEDKLELNIPDPGKVTVSILGLDKELQYSYSNGKMTIDTSNIGFNELPSYDAWTFKIEKKIIIKI